MNTTMHSIVCGYTRCWLRMIEMGMIEDTHDKWLDQEEEYMQEQREFYHTTTMYNTVPLYHNWHKFFLFNFSFVLRNYWYFLVCIITWQVLTSSCTVKLKSKYFAAGRVSNRTFEAIQTWGFCTCVLLQTSQWLLTMTPHTGSNINYYVPSYTVYSS